MGCRNDNLLAEIRWLWRREATTGEPQHQPSYPDFSHRLHTLNLHLFIKPDRLNWRILGQEGQGGGQNTPLLGDIVGLPERSTPSELGKGSARWGGGPGAAGIPTGQGSGDATQL